MGSWDPPILVQTVLSSSTESFPKKSNQVAKAVVLASDTSTGYSAFAVHAFKE